MLLGLSPLLSEPTEDITIRCSCGLSYQNAVAAQCMELIKSTTAGYYALTHVGAAKESIKSAIAVAASQTLTAHAGEAIKGTAAITTAPKTLIGSLSESFRLHGSSAQLLAISAHAIEAIKSSASTSTAVLASGQLEEGIKSTASVPSASPSWAGTSSEWVGGKASFSYSITAASNASLHVGSFVTVTNSVQAQGTLGIHICTRAQSSYAVQAAAIVGYQYVVRCSADLVAVTQLAAHLNYSISGAGVLAQQTELQAHAQETISGSAQIAVPSVRFYARRSGYPLYAKLSSSVICTVQTDGYILEATCVTQENWVDTLDTHMRKVTVQKNKRAKVDATANAKTTVKTKAVRTRKVVTKPHVNWVVVENKNG